MLAQLQEAAKQRREPPPQALRHHLLEGLLRRLACTSAAQDFVLRGGLLTRAWCRPWPRATRDLDLVGDFEFSAEDTRARFEPALHATVDDGVSIDPDRCEAQGIWLDTEFPGVRYTIQLGFGTPDRTLTVDIGFGDPLVPEAIWTTYPTLLEAPAAKIRAVRPETQAAWKLHGLAEMADSWRPKDLADLWMICARVPMKTQDLIPAVEAAFLSRHYTTDNAIETLEHDRWSTKTARVRWASHARGLPELPRAIQTIQSRFEGVFRSFR